MSEENVIEGLKEYKEAIKRDVLFEEIADKLITRDLLNNEEFHNISKINPNTKKIEYYLDEVLPTKKSGYACELCEVLCDAGFQWIVEKIKPSNNQSTKKRKSTPSRPKIQATKKRSVGEDVVDARKVSTEPVRLVAQTPVLAENNNIKIDEKAINLKLEVTKDMINIVKNDLYVITGWLSLAHSLDMDNCLPMLRQEMFLNPSSTDAIISSLIKHWINQNPKEANLGALIEGLKDAKLFQAASKLEDAYCKSTP